MDIFEKPLGGVPSTLRGINVSAARVADEAYVAAQLLNQFPDMTRAAALRAAADIVARDTPLGTYVKPR